MVFAFNAFVAIAVIVAITYLIGSGGGGSKAISDRLDEFSGPAGPGGTASADPFADEELNKSFFDRIVKPLAGKFANLLSKRSKTDVAAQAKKELAQAGNPGNLSPSEFNALKIMVMLAFPGLTFLLGLLFRVKPAVLVLFSGVVFVIAFLGPRIYLQRKIGGRKHAIVRSLPDCLDLLTVSVEAGLGFDQAMGKVVQKFKGALSEELAIVLQEMQMGKPRREALKSVAQKMEVDDLSAFISALVQADQLGVSVAKVLRVQSAQARLRRRQRAEAQAMQAPVKMLFPMVGCIFPTIMIVIFGGIGFSTYKILSNGPVSKMK